MCSIAWRRGWSCPSCPPPPGPGPRRRRKSSGPRGGDPPRGRGSSGDLRCGGSLVRRGKLADRDNLIIPVLLQVGPPGFVNRQRLTARRMDERLPDRQNCLENRRACEVASSSTYGESGEGTTPTSAMLAPELGNLRVDHRPLRRGTVRTKARAHHHAAAVAHHTAIAGSPHRAALPPGGTLRRGLPVLGGHVPRTAAARRHWRPARERGLPARHDRGCPPTGQLPRCCSTAAARPPGTAA